MDWEKEISMIEKKRFYSFRFGKCILQEIEWENLKCSKCGAKLPKYSKYDNNKNEIKTCEKCGESYMLIRHIPKEDFK